MRTSTSCEADRKSDRLSAPPVSPSRRQRGTMRPMSDMDDATTQTVRQQYEEFPYPAWDPQRDREGRYHTHLNTLAIMNHYCFQGRRDFLDRFAVLVAGGGTDATIIHLDISESSTAIARRRAQALGLDNITWKHGSLLDVGVKGEVIV